MRQIQTRALIGRLPVSEAKALVEQLKGGASFTELAKMSLDRPNSQSGGDLGYFSRGQMSKAFEDAAFVLEPGQISEPVQSEFGSILDETAAQQPDFGFSR